MLGVSVCTRRVAHGERDRGAGGEIDDPGVRVDALVVDESLEDGRRGATLVRKEVVRTSTASPLDERRNASDETGGGVNGEALSGCETRRGETEKDDLKLHDGKAFRYLFRVGIERKSREDRSTSG